LTFPAYYKCLKKWRRRLNEIVQDTSKEEGQGDGTIKFLLSGKCSEERVIEYIAKLYVLV